MDDLQEKPSALSDICYARNIDPRSLFVAMDRIRELEAKVFVPGVAQCARCGFNLVRSTIDGSGRVVAGENRAETCPNGCGVLQPITWREQADESRRLFERQMDRCAALEQQLAASELFRQSEDFSFCPYCGGRIVEVRE